MIHETFIQSPEYQDYLDNKSNISPDSLVFVEDKEKLITQEKEYQFVPSNGVTNQVLTKTEDGVEFKDLTIPEGCEELTPEDIDDIFSNKLQQGYYVYPGTITFTGTYGYPDINVTNPIFAVKISNNNKFKYIGFFASIRPYDYNDNERYEFSISYYEEGQIKKIVRDFIYQGEGSVDNIMLISGLEDLGYDVSDLTSAGVCSLDSSQPSNDNIIFL